MAQAYPGHCVSRDFLFVESAAGRLASSLKEACVLVEGPRFKFHSRFGGVLNKHAGCFLERYSGATCLRCSQATMEQHKHVKPTPTPYCVEKVLYSPGKMTLDRLLHHSTI